MSNARSRWGSAGLASKQLAGEWEPFKRQGDLNTAVGISPWRTNFYNLVPGSLSLTLIQLVNLCCLISHRRQFCESCFREKKESREEKRRDSSADGDCGEIKKEDMR